MKISNETKVGALTAIAIVVLILGFNYLKGKNLTERNEALFAIFENVEGLLVSSPVFINGFQVGKIADMQAKDSHLSGIVVKISLTKEINIPDNSVAIVNSELLQSTSVIIKMGSSPTYVKDGDTLSTTGNPGIMGEVRNSLNPTIASVNKALSSLDTLIRKINSVIDPRMQNNIQSVIGNLASSSQALRDLLHDQHRNLARSFENIEGITENLKKNGGRIDTTLTNLQAASAKLANAKIDEIIAQLNATMAKLQTAVEKTNSKDGTLGLLLNDRKLYDDLVQTNRSLHILFDDLRLNPKRYVSFSVFGKKAKGGPITKPASIDSIPK